MKILIIRFSSFGDIILATPIIKKIKEKYPNAMIDFIVYDTFQDAISLNPNIRKLIIFKKNESKNSEYIKNIIKQLKEEKYDFIIDLHSKFLSKIIGKSLKTIDNEYLKYKKRKWWKTILVKLKLISYNVDSTIVESYFTALKKLDILYNKNEFENENGDKLEYYIDKKIENTIVNKYNLKEKKYIVLAPGASKNSKKWPYFNEICKKILNNTDFEIIVIGGKEDYNYIVEKSDRLLNLCGKISFKESGVILKYCELALVNDSGPFHIARAVKSKVFVIFIATNPKLFNFEKNTILINNNKVKPWSLYGENKCSKKYYKSIENITVDKVFQKMFLK